MKNVIILKIGKYIKWICVSLVKRNRLFPYDLHEMIVCAICCLLVRHQGQYITSKRTYTNPFIEEKNTNDILIEPERALFELD